MTGGGMRAGWVTGRGARALSIALLVGLVGLSTAGLLGQPAAAQAPKGSGMATIRLITFAPRIVLSVALGRGFFAAEGLNVAHTLTTSSAQMMNGVVDGTYDMALTNPDNWITYVTRDNADVFMFA